MTETDYNADLTDEERPIHSPAGGMIDGGLGTDEGGFKRLVNPLTGAGVFNTNTDPAVVGIDPLTGASSLSGTDVGFGAPMRRYLSSLVYNGAFEEPPPDITVPIADDNPLPYWRWVDSSGSAMVPYWVAVGSGALNGQVNCSMKSGAAGDLGYFEQLVPVNPSQGNTWYYRVLPYVLGSNPDMDAYVHCQFIDATGATTGTAATDSGDFSAVSPLYPDTDGSASGIAAYLRVRVGWQRNSGAATTATATGILSEVAVNGSNAYGIYDYQAGNWTPTLTAGVPGDLSVVYTTRLGRYVKVNRMCTVWFTILTSTWTHTTASGQFQLTGLPFTAATASGQFWIGSAVLRYTKANYTVTLPLVQSASSTVIFRTIGSGQTITNIAIAETPSGTQVNCEGSVTYETAT